MTRRSPAHVNPRLSTQAVPSKIVSMVRTALAWKSRGKRQDAAGFLRLARAMNRVIALDTWRRCR